MKFKKKGASKALTLIVTFIILIIVAFVVIKFNVGTIGKAKAGILYPLLETEIRACAAKNTKIDIPGLETSEDVDLDEDNFPDSCDICLGTGIDDGDGKNGENNRDQDKDFYPDDCDYSPYLSEEHECVYQLCQIDKTEEDKECIEYLNQCCTPEYKVYLEDLMEESGAGALALKCELVNARVGEEIPTIT